MLHPITMLLLALLSASLSPADYRTQPNLPLTFFAISDAQRQPFVFGDSLVFKDLKANLERRQKETAPEKIYLHLDRTLYQPGETIWFGAYIRNAGDLMPSLQSQILHVELLDSRGAVLQKKTYLAFDGTAAGDFEFSKDLPGGLYKIKAYTRWMQNTSEVFERSVTLQKVVLPNLNLKLEFERKAFGPSDVAIARFDAHSLDNKPLANQKLRFTAAVGGQQFTNGDARTDANGRAYVRFQLPSNIETADGLLNIQIEHGGQTEAISRAIPLVLNKIDLQFFPEGGDAIASLPCRMAFKAVNEFGKPADVEGTVLNSRGEQVAAFSSYHDGMGAFDFVPQPGEHYEARLTKPFSSEKTFALPEIQTTGYALRLQERNAGSLTFEVAANQPGKVYLVGQSQDKLFFFKEINLAKATAGKVVVPTKDLPIGIVRFTLFDHHKNEQAERLAFVNRDRRLKIELRPDKEKYLPREQVKMKIRVADHAGRPVQGKFSLAVADENQLTFANDKQGHLLASLLLEQDVKGNIEEPNFYFDPAEPKSEQALDYLLMTQGWRRFDWKEVQEAQPVAFQQPGERTVVEGQLFRKNGKPLAQAKLSLHPNGPSTTTDLEGCFSFKNVDIEKYTHLLFGRDVYYPIYEYGSNYALSEKGGSHVAPAKIRRIPAPTASALLQGRILDDTGEPLIGATVKVLKGNELVRGTITDYDGIYHVKPLNPGTYNVEISYTGYTTQKTTGVKVLAGQITFLDDAMSNSMVLNAVEVAAYKVPLIKQDQTVSGGALTSEQIRSLPTRSMNAIVATTAGTTSKDDDDIKIKSSRSDATEYYIDGVRVTGAPPPALDDEMKIMRGGTPANMAGEAPMNEVTVTNFKIPLTEPDKTASGQAFSSSQLQPRSYAKRSTWAKEEKPMSMGRYRNQTFSRARTFYAPKYESQKQPAQRSDFRSTLYWNPNIQTDKKGEAEVEFFTSDAITNFRATLEGIGNQGQVGRTEQKFFVQKPLSIAVKVPASVISGDVLQLQIAISNKTNYAAGGYLNVAVPEHFSPKNEIPANAQLAPGETKTITAEYVIGLQKIENQTVSIKFSADENVLDAFETTVRTLDRGFPVKQIASGNAAQNAFNIRLHEPVEGTVSATLTAYPNALEDVLKGMERMLRQPSGCFEQVSSSNYPNLLVLDLLRQTGTAKPEVESRAMTLLEDGYKKLTAYECKSGGFDWYGRDPAHEGLTAYGILEFTDMAKVFAVDKKMIDRTVAWMLSRRDGKGSWQVNPQSLHGWKKDGVLDAYIAWAVAEAGYGKQFAAEIEHARQQAEKSGDPYQLALLANALLAAKDKQGKVLLTQLLDKQAADGSWTGTSHSVFHAYGNCFQIETTALAALALMKSGETSAALQKAIDYLIQSKTEYGYGSTQSTVLALKALVEYAKIGNQSAADGSLVVQVDGRRVAEQPYSTCDAKRLEIKNLEQFFTSNNPRVEVFFENSKAAIPFDLEIKYASRQPRNAKDCPISFQTNLGQNTAKIGETVRLTASLKNETAQPQASPMLVLGIPAGLTLQPWQLKKIVDEKQCDFYELWDGFAVFHFEKIGANETRTLHLDLRADVAGTFEAPASQAFLYYTNDQRVWSKPERVVVNAQ
ncbi:MAG: carboxypeptidase regulatory-like domain-containing protein [Saprospiraceae bacterium]|nr:carboxypeptidase regulatory-like domain-containing protein [Saprospiraceae bacterium]